jgi:dihydroorotase (multifunctional complex type)
MADLLIAGGRCALPGGVIEADLLIEAGRIRALAAPGEAGPAAERIDARGLLVLPGAVDAHVHVRDPGQTHKEDYAHATRAAAATGVTTIISQPNTTPAPINPAGLSATLEAARASRVDHAICAGILSGGPDLETARELARAGAAAFEVLDDTAQLDGYEWLRLFEAVAPTGLPLAYLAADRALCRQSLARARIRPDASWRDFTAAVTGPAEALGYQRAVALAAATGARLIIRQLTTAEGLAALRRLRREHPDLSFWVEVNVHHLFLTDDDLERLGPYAQMVPPPRPAVDVAALWTGLLDGTIDFVSTDHAPHTREEKERGRADLWTAPTGIPGLDSFLPLLLDAALRGRLPLARLVDLVCEAPAAIHRLPGKGRLTPGYDADLLLVDPNRSWTLDAARIFTKCGWSAFEGRELLGAPVLTLLRGQAIAQDGVPVDRPVGRLVRPA